MEIRSTLSQDNMDEFLKDLCKHEIMMHWIHLDSPKDECIRLVYDTGDFEIITKRKSEYAGSMQN